MAQKTVTYSNCTEVQRNTVAWPERRAPGVQVAAGGYQERVAHDPHLPEASHAAWQQCTAGSGYLFARIGAWLGSRGADSNHISDMIYLSALTLAACEAVTTKLCGLKQHRHAVLL